MARANPDSSFEASARHLFRHLNDAAALRSNPLVRSHFSAETAPDAVLLRIHTHVLNLAELLCEELESQGRELQAHRRREIVVALCKGEAVTETASRLALSRSQYYRERHAASAGIARALRRATATRDARCIVRDDSVRLLFTRAEALRDAGRAREAVSILQNAYASLTESSARFTVGLSLAQELVFLGNHERARHVLAQSRAFSRSGEHDAGGWLSDYSAFYEARLESQLGADANAGTALERLAKRRIGEHRVDDVTFDAVFLAGEGYRNAGRYREARIMLNHLRSTDQRFVQAVPKRQIAASLLAAYCVEGCADELGVAETSMRNAYDLSISSGILVGALLSMAGLIRLEAGRRDDDAAYAMAHEALRMADGADFGGFLGYVTTGIGAAMLRTRYWRAVDPLIFQAERLTAPGTLARASIKHVQGSFLTMMGQRARALEALQQACAIARNLGNRRIEGLILRDRAVALAGTTPEQVELMREAVTLIERHGSADDLPATYGAAARIIRDRRSVRLAHQAVRASRDPAPSLRASRNPSAIKPLILNV